MDNLMTPQEVAKIFNVNYRKVLELVHLGKLRAHRIGRVIRISPETVQQFLNKTQVKSPWSK